MFNAVEMLLVSTKTCLIIHTGLTASQFNVIGNEVEDIKVNQSDQEKLKLQTKART